MNEYRRLADQPARSARKQGDAVAAIHDAAHQISASYEFPYLAHAPMEPLDAVVKLGPAVARSGAGDQFQTVDQFERRENRRSRSEPSQHPHAVCRGKLRPAREYAIRLHRRSGVHCEGIRRGWHCDQIAVDTRGRHSRRLVSPPCTFTSSKQVSTTRRNSSAGAT